MKINVDMDRCVGGGQCALLASAVFDQDDDTGLVVVLDGNPSEEQRSDVEAAVAACPGRALAVEDSPGA